MPDGATFADTITVTLFYSFGATRKTERRYSWPQLQADILAATGKAKADLPWLKLARFGDAKTRQGSLRHDANVLAITGIEADYDGEQVTMEAAAELLEKAGVRAMLYTSPSHTDAAPRWRVLCPCSTELPPDRREHLVGRLNGALGGVLAGESFTLSQAYYFGSIDRNPAHHALMVDGQPIDLCDELDKAWIGKPATTGGGPGGQQRKGKADTAALLAEIVSGASYHEAAVRLAGVWASAGIAYVEAKKRLEAAFDATPEAERDDRWKARREDIDRCLQDIYGKEARKKDRGERPRKGGSADAEAIDIGDIELTEDGVAIEFTNKHRNRLRYCHDTGKWFVWTGSHWRLNRDHVAFHWARGLTRELNREEEFRTKAITGKVAFAAGVEKFAQRDRAFAVTAETWDRNNTLLGTPDGTVDLVTGELRPARQEDFITKVTAVAPAATAGCPMWIAFLKQATAGDAGLIRFLQQWCGYCLTGSTREHALLFIFGPGGNGKSVFLNILAWILGDYHQTAAMDTFTSSHGEKHPTDLAMLRGARMVTATETEEGRAWAEARIKQMTGGDPIAARFMRQDYFTFTPNFKLTIAGNHKPALKVVDDAARRRFNIVPFLHKPEKPDRQLEAKLKKEGPGILRWMIEGCLDWQKNGLVRPAVVTEATADYFEAQDFIGRWMSERCILSAELAEKPGRLLKDCMEWCQQNGEPATDNRSLRGVLEKTPGCRYVTVRGIQLVRGIGLRPRETGASGGWGA